MKKQYVLLTVGISGSGKTTWANDKVKNSKGTIVNVNRDDLRSGLFGLNSKSDYKFSKDKEKLVTSLQKKITISSLEAGKNIIISDTNISTTTRNRWREFCKTQNVEYKEEVLDVPVEECQKRNALRADGIPPNVIYDQYRRFNQQFGEKYKPDITKRKAIIVGIDGTLAHMNGGRSPYDWDKVLQDTVDFDIKFIVNSYFLSDVRVVVLSGRDGRCYPDTAEWLTNKGVYHDFLYMREEKDTRPDTIIKKELFDKHIRGNYNVVLALDDRPCMVDMWNDLGIKTIAVADQRIKF